jgi:anti-anti-sigma factor
MAKEIIELSEDLTSSSVDDLRRQVEGLIDNTILEIELDFTKVDVIDSTGIGFLIRMHNSLKEKEGTLSIIGVNAEIMRLMKIMRLDKHFSIVE